MGSAPPLRYDSKVPETWPSFLRRVRNYINSKGNIADGQKKGILLDALDDPTLDRLDRWLEPISTEDATYTLVLTTLTDRMSTPVNPTAQYIKFTARRQQSGESVLAYHEALSVMVSTIGIAERPARDALVMHQFIAGLADESLQNRILDLDECTLGKAVDTAAQHESTRRSAAVLRTDTVGVYKVDGTVKCYFCAGPHLANACTEDRSKLLCAKCKLKGHVADACKGGAKKKKKPFQRGRKPAKEEESTKNAKKDTTNFVHDVPPTAPEATPQATPAWHAASHGAHASFDLEGLFFMSADAQVPPPDMVSVSVQGRALDFILDNGAGRTMVSMATYNALPDKPPLRPIPKMFSAWDPAMVITVEGFCGVQVVYKGICHTLPLLVARGTGPNLLGRNWFRALGFAMVQVDSVNRIEDCSEILQLVKQYSAVSSPSIGRYNGTPVHIHVDPAKAPKYHAARPVKLPLVTKMEEQIDAYVEAGLWVPINQSEWASGLVPVPKQDGRLRLCADYKATVNPAITADPYKSPSVDVVLDALGGGMYFAEIDLREAYTQVPCDDESSRILAVNTIKGLHRVTRLPFGVKVAPAIFQRIMDGLFGGVPGVTVYQDNIYVKSGSLEEHKTRLHDVLSILSNAGFTVNADKCTWISSELNVLGYRISREGVHPREDKLDAIKKAPAPQNVEQLQSWLGLVSFYERFFQGKSHILEPLHRLLDAGSAWQWGRPEQRALDLIKERISSDTVLVHYSLDKAVSIVCDASPYGVGAVLCHTVQLPDGTKEERPVRFASRTLTRAERNYSQLDKEALAIMFAIKKFSRYIYGRRFLIVTDHRPLVSLFDPAAPIGENLSPRMTRWAIALSALDYRIVHRAGADIGHADFLSRQPLPDFGLSDMYPEPSGIFLLEAKTPDLLSAESVAAETAKDPLLKDVLEWVTNGWPATVPPVAGPFAQKKNSLSVHRDCLLMADRVVVPTALRSQVLDLLHATHPGITCSKAIGKAIVWWPKWCDDVEDAVKRCTACQLEAKMPTRQPYSPWPAPQRCWQRVHLDYAGPFLGHQFLIAVDAYSKWTVIKVMPNMSSAALIATLRYMFADYGCPEEIVADNGRSLIAKDTKDFLDRNGVRLLHSPPWHPASNGLAERTVFTFKTTMARFAEGDIHTRLARTLWSMRAKPSSVTGKSPALLFLGRELAHHLERLHPRSADHAPPASSASNPFKVGSTVWFYRHAGKGSGWLPAQVSATNGARSCDVTLANGEVRSNTHVNHLRPRLPDVGAPVAPDTEQPPPQDVQRAPPVDEVLTPPERRDEHREERRERREERRDEQRRNRPPTPGLFEDADAPPFLCPCGIPGCPFAEDNVNDDDPRVEANLDHILQAWSNPPPIISPPPASPPGSAEPRPDSGRGRGRGRTKSGRVVKVPQRFGVD